LLIGNSEQFESLWGFKSSVLYGITKQGIALQRNAFSIFPEGAVQVALKEFDNQTFYVYTVVHDFLTVVTF
jgi:hypothetical protein